MAIRWTLRRILREKGILTRSVASAFSDDEDDFSEELELDAIEEPEPFAQPVVLERPGTRARRVGPELTFITGVGVAKTRMRGKYRSVRSAANVGKPGAKREANAARGTPPALDRNFPMAMDGMPTSLREFVREMLVTEFNPPLITYIPERLPGTLAIRQDTLEAWIQAQRANLTLP